MAARSGVKPLVGLDARLREPGDRAEPSRIVLLCQDESGYRNLTRLVSPAYLEGQGRHGPTLDRSWLGADTVAGLIALSAGREGDVGRAILNGRLDEARLALEQWLRLFGDRYYLELQRTGRAQEEECLAGSLELAGALGVPVVASNDVRFLARGDFEAHEARVCIHEGHLLADPTRPRRYGEQQYLRSPEEMAELFADLPARLVVRPGTAFSDASGNLPAWVGPEIMAQAISALAGTRSLAAHGRRAAIGLLLGVCSYEAPEGDFRCGDALRVEVVESSEDEEGRAVFDCTISSSGELLAAGVLTVYQPPDDTFLAAECARDD